MASNSKSTFVVMGAHGHGSSGREENDYYATDPVAVEMLLDLEAFSDNIWECACGEGHISKVLEGKGFNVKSTDLIDRGFGDAGIDFLAQTEIFDGDIITNPPYKYAKEFVEHAINTVTSGHKVVMFLKIQFLEGRARRELFDKYPPKTIYISSSRLSCPKNGDFSAASKKNYSAQAYAWYVWEKGYDGDTIVKWFN